MMATRPAILTPPEANAGSMQNITLFRIYVFYRSALSILLFLMLFNPDIADLVGTLNPALYFYVSIIYITTNLVLIVLLATPLADDQRMLFVVFFIDLVALTLLADASRGMASGLPILLVITVAASAILITNGTIATLIAALGVIGLLADTTRLIGLGVLSINSLFPAGLLGLLIFTVSLLVQLVARRVGSAEELARKRASDLYDLQRLNEQIVQHLQTGILLVQESGEVRTMNHAAIRLLAPQRPAGLEQGRKLADYHVELARQFETWQETGQHRGAPLQVGSEQSSVIAHFSTLQGSSSEQSLVFVEDYSLVTQYAQSLKLASLGRLTASIAHEIRNPLGAVSHAAQLLQESHSLIPADERLATIIQQHAVRMNSIIENVMEISRREPPKPQLISLRLWLQQFVDDYRSERSSATSVSVDVQFPEQDIEVEFDTENFERILGNLLDNGIRHSELAGQGRRSDIVLSDDTLRARCYIDVVDYGTGVAVAEQAKLFEPFYTTVDQGTGLGLFLSKELCEINNASLSYKPTAQGQSCFRVTLNKRT